MHTLEGRRGDRSDQRSGDRLGSEEGWRGRNTSDEETDPTGGTRTGTNLR